MPKEVYFRVTNRLTRNTGQQVLVFLTPIANRFTHDLFVSAWQVLNPAANGGNQPFFYCGLTGLAVEDESTLCRSAQVEVRPNQLYEVSNNDNQGPVLTLSVAQSPPSTRQVALLNASDPAITLTAIWSVDGNPVLLQPGINLGSMATFELQPTFFFAVAVAGLAAQGMTQYSSEFPYLLPLDGDFQGRIVNSYAVPAGAQRVEVSWSRPGGMSGADYLTFDPPSSPIVPPLP